MSGLGPTAETLSFAPPKESIQRKGGPDAAYSLRFSLLPGVAERGFLPLRQRAASLRRPYGLFTRYLPVPRPSGAAHANRLSCRFVPPKAPVLGAAYGITPSHNPRSNQGTSSLIFKRAGTLFLA